MFNTSSAVQSALGLKGVFTPIQDFVDGVQIISLRPAGTVTTFHLALDVHDCVFANNIPVESYHPGPALDQLASFELRPLFKSLFAHVDDRTKFGAQLAPKLSLAEIETLNAA